MIKKAKDCYYGEKVKILTTYNGCKCAEDVIGTISTIEEHRSAGIINRGWTPSAHRKEDIAFVRAEKASYCISGECEVKVLEATKENNDINMKKTSYKIVDYKVYDNKVVVVKFDDNTEEKAVCCNLDDFDIERGIEVCVMKHICGGNDTYKSILHTANRQIKDIDKAKEAKKAQEELVEKKKAKAAKRKAKYLENKRKERVEEMTEAYVKALKKVNGETNNTVLDKGELLLELDELYQKTN